MGSGTVRRLRTTERQAQIRRHVMVTRAAATPTNMGLTVLMNFGFLVFGVTDYAG
jgi:hypothetical protein